MFLASSISLLAWTTVSPSERKMKILCNSGGTRRAEFDFIPSLPLSDAVLQLDALMAVAHDIPALHRVEHPGDNASSLGADDFLPIFIYVLVNSRVENLAAQSVILETLCDPKKMMGEAGGSVYFFGVKGRRRVDHSSPALWSVPGTCVSSIARNSFALEHGWSKRGGGVF